MADDVKRQRLRAVIVLLSGVGWIMIGLGTASNLRAEHALHWWWILFVIAAVGLGAFCAMLGLFVFSGRTVLFTIRRPRRR